MKPSMTFRLKNGNILPNAREVSSMIHGQPQEDVEDTINSLMVMQFGQFIDHDITLTAEAEKLCQTCDLEPIQCCDYYLGLRNYTIDQMPAECWPIPVPETDQVFQGSRDGSGIFETRGVFGFWEFH